MKIFTCRICGEVYIGEAIPRTCPFCGAANKYLILANAWKDENNIELTEISRENLEEALKLELSNASFYKCASETISNQEIALMFKGLYKVEREHASVFRKILKLTSDPEIKEMCVDDAKKTVEESLEREMRAIKFYGKAANQASEPRLKEVFTAIMGVEKDHLSLDHDKLLKL